MNSVLKVKDSLCAVYIPQTLRLYASDIECKHTENKI